jgi:hypothetical protein
LIWGHGQEYKNEIINRIHKQEYIEIIRIENHSPNNMRKFINRVYSKDYVPYYHLISKTSYLRSKPNKVTFIFVKNNNSQEYFSRTWGGIHIEDSYINNIKNELRMKYNPVNEEGKTTEQHIIHASDNEDQVDDILKYLGHSRGLRMFMTEPNKIIHLPYYLDKFNSFCLSSVDVAKVAANVLSRHQKSGKCITNKVSIFDTPHYHALDGSPNSYIEYMDEFRGHEITRFHTLAKFLAMASNFEYLESPYNQNFILVKQRNIKNFEYQILDGVHRAAILAKSGIDRFPVAKISTNV